MSQISFFHEDCKRLSIKRDEIQQRIQFLLSKEGRSCGDLSIVFCSDDYILNINKEYLSHTYYTDIITFDYSENQIVSGDLFISIDRVKENALKYQVSFKEELTRVILHGVLHLAGYKDGTKCEKEEMRLKEDFYLKNTVYSGDGSYTKI